MRKKKEKNYLENLDEEEILRQLQELEDEENGKKKKKNLNKDAITVLAILGVLLIVAVLATLLRTPTDNPEIQKFLQDVASTEKKKEQLGIILTGGFIGVFLVTLFVMKKIRDKKREAKLRREQLKKLKKTRDLERARQRVHDAKMEAFLNAGKSEIEKRQKDEKLLRYQGREGYVRRDLNLYKDENYRDEEEYEEEELGFFARMIAKVKDLVGNITNRDSDDEEED